MERTPIEGYKNESIELHYLSDLELPDAKKIIGRKIIKVEGSEYELRLTLDDNTIICIQGSRFGDGSLGVKLEE